MIYGLTTFEKITETRCGKKKNLKLFDFGKVQFKGYFSAGKIADLSVGVFYFKGEIVVYLKNCGRAHLSS